MKVAELITRLNELPPDAEVWIKINPIEVEGYPPVYEAAAYSVGSPEDARDIFTNEAYQTVTIVGSVVAIAGGGETP